jgi:hypothetical protein
MIPLDIIICLLSIIHYPPGPKTTVKVVLYLRVGPIPIRSWAPSKYEWQRTTSLSCSRALQLLTQSPILQAIASHPSTPALARDGNDFSRQHLLASSLPTAGYNLKGSTDDAAHLAIASNQLPGRHVGARPINTIAIAIAIAITFPFTRTCRTPTVQLVRGGAFQTALRDRSDRADAEFPPTDTSAGAPPRAGVCQPRCEACVSRPSDATCRGRGGGVEGCDA